MSKGFYVLIISASLVIMLLRDTVTNTLKFKSWPSLNMMSVSIECNKNFEAKLPALSSNISDLWRSVPSFELNIRLSSFEPRWFWTYQRWFLRSFRLFWPPELYNLTIVLNAEIPGDFKLGNQISLMWPFPRVVYVEKPALNAIGSSKISDRFRMYFDAFYPDLYTNAEYVGFVDTDTLFITPVTPQSLFDHKKPIVVGVAGNVQYAPCTEFMLKQKQLMICMSYFPVTIKVSHLVAMRQHIEKLHQKSFREVFGLTVLIIGGGKDGCLCQYAVMCNYIYRFHADEYSFRIQMHPDDKLSNKFSESEKIPFPRVAIHSRHLIPYHVIDAMDKASNTIFNERIKEGICRAIGFQWCPNIYCAEFNKSSLQQSLFAFEHYNWSWDQRCLQEQNKHYKNVRDLINYNVQNDVKIFGHYEKKVDVCTIL